MKHKKAAVETVDEPTVCSCHECSFDHHKVKDDEAHQCYVCGRFHYNGKYVRYKVKS